MTRPFRSPSRSDVSRTPVGEAHRVVIKVGTRVLADDDGRIARPRLQAIVAAVADLRRAGREVLLVTSGAVGIGQEALGMDSTRQELADRQACAAVGQGLLMALYQTAFKARDVIAAQVLLTEADFDDRVRYLNLRSTLITLLRRPRVVPVINENDVVSTEELAFHEGASRPVFGDNDKLSALVATKLGASLLVLLTDVDGVYDRAPGAEGARRLTRIEDVAAVADAVGGAASDLGRGGMASKVAAAALAARGGCHAVIASGLEPGMLLAVLAGDEVGTWFPAEARLDARRMWIAYAAAPRGALHLDAGAVGVLRDRGASLLAAGVQRVEGAFERGDVVELCDPNGHVVGRGIVYCDAQTARRWVDGERPVGVQNHHALVHRDHMVLEVQP
ncbi:MAG: glutamate 5-kinase [Phycisphaeraceae bacterium]|nr:glutamate 5-kinase [Phycisphaeraceae bacterium]